MIKKRMFLLLGILMFIAAAGAQAETRFGVRAGASIDPNQFHFGGHMVSAPLLANLTFRPNLEIGVGSGITTLAANFEVAYGIPIPKRDLAFYIGAGPARNIYRIGASRVQDGSTDAGGGFNILVGIERPNGLMGEIKVGMIDSPEFKFTIGYTF